MATIPNGEDLDLQPGQRVEIRGQQMSATKLNAAKTYIAVRDGRPVPPPPEPEPEPEPVVTNNILGVDLTKRPQSGTLWTQLRGHASRDFSVTLTATDGAKNGELLAAAFVAQATNDAALKARVITACANALDGPYARTLEQSRTLAPIAIALSAIEHHGLDADLKRERDHDLAQGDQKAIHERRPNNWGTCGGLARIAVSAHIGDTAEVAAAIKVFRGWLGDRAVYAGFSYGDLSWQGDPTKPVGINAKGAARSGVNVDGILPDDQRRQSETGSRPVFPTYACENYVFQALGEVVGTALILRANGYPDVFEWSDRAIARAYDSLRDHGCSATGDDGWQGAAARIAGSSITAVGYEPGKSFGWVDWLYS